MKTSNLPPNPLEFIIVRKIYFLNYVISLLFAFFFLWPNISLSQLNVSIVQSGTNANSCSRTLTAQVQNGSGSYSYNWSISTPGIPFPGPNNTRTIQVGLNQPTTFTVSVTDNSSNFSGSASTSVQGVLLGDFNMFRPNAFTPNNDGYNDQWMVTDEDHGYGTINAYYYKLIVRNLNNNVLYQVSNTITSGYLGLFGGDISWNGRINGTGNLVPVGTYTYSLKVQNCSVSTTFNGYLDVLY